MSWFDSISGALDAFDDTASSKVQDIAKQIQDTTGVAIQTYNNSVDDVVLEGEPDEGEVVPSSACECASLRQVWQETREQLKQSQVALSDEVRRHELSLSSLESAHKVALASVQSQHSQLLATHQAQHTQLGHTLESREAQLRAEADDLRNGQQQLQTLLATERSRFAVERHELERRVRELGQIAHTQSQSLRAVPLHAPQPAVPVEHTVLTAKNNRLSTQVSELTTALQEVQTQLALMTSTAADRESSVSRHEASLQTQLSSAHTQLIQTRSTCDALEAERLRLGAQCADVARDNADLRVRLANADSRVETRTNQTADSALRTAYESMCRENTVLKEEAARLRTTLATAQTKPIQSLRSPKVQQDDELMVLLSQDERQLSHDDAYSQSSVKQVFKSLFTSDKTSVPAESRGFYNGYDLELNSPQPRQTKKKAAEAVADLVESVCVFYRIVTRRNMALRTLFIVYMLLLHVCVFYVIFSSVASGLQFTSVSITTTTDATPDIDSLTNIITNK